MVYDPSAIERLLERKRAAAPDPSPLREIPEWVGPIKEVPCPECSSMRFVFQSDHDYENPDITEPCHRCETPGNPTRGWLFREYARRGLSDKDLRAVIDKSSGKDNQKVDNFLRKAMGIEVKTATKADLEKEAAAKESAR